MSKLAPLLLNLIVWTLPPTSCPVASLSVWDSYINGPDYGNHAEGVHFLPPSQTSVDIAPGKPVVNCAIAYQFPVALDLMGQPLGPECQPTPVSADGLSWEGM